MGKTETTQPLLFKLNAHKQHSPLEIKGFFSLAPLSNKVALGAGSNNL